MIIIGHIVGISHTFTVDSTVAYKRGNHGHYEDLKNS